MSEQPSQIGLQTDGRLEQRNIIGTTFLALIISLAYQESVRPFVESIQARGFALGTVALFVMFFTMGLNTFLVGHLLLPGFRGMMWFYVFVIMVFECTVLIFMAGLTSEEANRGLRFTFIDGLVVYYAVKIAYFPVLFGNSLANVKYVSGFIRKFLAALLLTALGPGLVLLQLWASRRLQSSEASVSSSRLFFGLMALEVITLLITGMFLDRYMQMAEELRKENRERNDRGSSIIRIER
jgi:hypothetical protein